MLPSHPRTITASPVPIVNVFPFFLPLPRAMSVWPIAGARKVTLYSTVKISVPAGLTVMAANPQALSMSAVTTAAWR